jgi:hypothetical protein
MPISMVISFLLRTCSYNEPGLPWPRNVLDGFKVDLASHICHGKWVCAILDEGRR